MPDPLPAPVVKIVLGQELARQRLNAGLTQDDARSTLHCSQQKIDYVERGGGVKPLELTALLDRYGVTDSDRAYILGLHAVSGQRTHRSAFRSRFDHHMRLLIDMEPTCQRYFCYRAMVVPGILQTEQYMRALFQAWHPAMAAAEINQAICDRLARQHALDDTERQFHFVLDEAAVRRMPGDATLITGQLNRLLDISECPNVELQILPFESGYYMGQAHEYTIFGYAANSWIDIVYLERHDGGEYLDAPGKIAKYHTLSQQQQAAAIGGEAARTLLRKLLATR